jgi:thiol peroxidase
MTTTTAERSGIVTFRGAPMTLLGPHLTAGDRAPDFTAADAGLGAFTLADATAKGTRAALFIVVPSVDTPTCSKETLTFQERASELPASVAAFVVSADLPFAQARWAAAHSVDKLAFLSDYRERSFGSAYGVVLKELALLARANFLVKADGTLAYVEIVPEIGDEPDYAATFAAIHAL